MAYNGNVAYIPLGELGLLTDMPPANIPRGALIGAKNISYETGTITKAPGSLRYNASALPAGVVALFDWWPDTITQRLIAACSDGKIYRDIGDKSFSGNTAIATGLGNLNPKCMFVEAGAETASRSKKLFFFSMTSQVKVLEGDGTSFETIDSPASDWTTPNYPQVAVVHRNRLWAFMKQRAYASNTGDHENFTSSILTQDIYPGEGGNVVGAKVFRGKLFAFKDGGFVYILNDEDADSDNWYWSKLSSNFGLSSPHGIIEVMNDLVAVNESGSPTSYNAVETTGDFESADLLRVMQIEENFRNNTSLSGLNVLHAIYYAAKKQAFFTWRTGYYLNNDMLFHIDFNKQGTGRAAYWTKDNADCLALRKDINKVLRPIYGASDGYVYLMDREDRLVGGSAYQGEFKTGHMDFRFLDEKLANKNKLFDWLAVEYVPQGNWTLSVDVYIDGDFVETISFTMNTRNDGLDTFTLGTGGGSGLETAEGGDGDPLGREETQTEQKPLHGSGRRISFRCRQAGSNQSFNLASLLVGFRLSDEKASKAT